MSVFLLSFSLAPFSLTAGCKSGEIESYRVAKQPEAKTESVPSMEQMPQQTGDKASSGEIPPGHGMNLPEGHVRAQPIAKATWTVPESWTEKPGSSLRVGSFTVPGPNDQKAEVSVIALPGEAGGALANINLWREQVGLLPVEKASDSSSSAVFGGHKMTLVDVTSEQETAPGKQKGRILAALYPREEETWFFKMTGDAPAVEANRESFITFLNSVKFDGE